MDQRLISRPGQFRARPMTTPATIIVILVIGVDLFIVADLFAGDTCSLADPICQNGKEESQHNEWAAKTNELPPASQDDDDDDGCFRAAVFENNRFDKPDDYGQAKEINLALFDRVASVAAKHGAHLIVFPEDGIVHGVKRLMVPHLQEIPDPDLLSSDSNNPCLQPELYQASDILRNLSCIARANRLYVVANFGTRQNCTPGERVGERDCPESGFFGLNTDVVLDPSGRFLKRYRKYNLFTEIFDHPPALEEVYFDSPFGRFGVFTCFDIVFKRPAMNLVERHKIDTVLFPTWWFDEAPMLTAVSSQDAWSLGNKVNLLAANMFRRELGSVGSGIYSGNNSFFTTAASRGGKLLVANVASHPRRKQCTKSFDPISVDIDSGYPVREYRNQNYKLQESDSIYTLEANKLEGKKTVCSKQVCCTLDYKLAGPAASEHTLARMVLIARDNNRLGMYNFYEQVCALVTLESPINPNNLTETSFSAGPLVAFERLSVRGTFNSTHVFPFGNHQKTQPIKREQRQFECHDLGANAGLVRCQHSYSRPSPPSGIADRVYSFGMYGRVYDRDIMPEGWN